MKSIVLTDIRKMKIRETPKPQVKAGNDILLKIETVGICGSDVHYYSTGRIGDQIVKYPFTIGHECSASVMEVGSNVTHIKIGNRVAIEPAVSCWRCDQCLSGRPHTCRNLKFLGCPGQIDGCLSEYLIMPEESCHKIPVEMSFEQAALIEPLSIGVYAVDFLNEKANSVAILGSGPIGLSVLLTLKAAGIENVYMTDKVDDRVKIAKKAGACWSGNPDKTDIIAEIKQKEQGSLDTVFECCGDQDALNQSIELLKSGGQLILIGIPEHERIYFNIHKLRRKEISIQNVRRQNNCVRKAIDLVHSGRIDTDFMITHRFNFEETDKAFELVENYRDGVIKAMVKVG